MSHEGNPADLERLWRRVREGQTTALVGRLPEPPPGLHVLRVSCDVAPAELRPLLEARRSAEAILDEEQPLLDQARERVVSGLRRRLLGEAEERTTAGVLVEVWNNLARQSGRTWALVLEAVEAADATTLATLTQIVRRPGWLQLPLVMVFRAEPGGEAARLLASLAEHAGTDAVLRGDLQRAPAAATDLRALPLEVLRVLRAGALVGPGFEAGVVAALLEERPLAVLERLQQAADLGVAVEDRGEGRFSLPAADIESLARSILPSLAQAWHRRLGELLGGRADDGRAYPQEPSDMNLGQSSIEQVEAEGRGVAAAPPDATPTEVAAKPGAPVREAAAEAPLDDDEVFARRPNEEARPAGADGPQPPESPEVGVPVPRAVGERTEPNLAAAPSAAVVPAAVDAAAQAAADELLAEAREAQEQGEARPRDEIRVVDVLRGEGAPDSERAGWGRARGLSSRPAEVVTTGALPRPRGPRQPPRGGLEREAPPSTLGRGGEPLVDAARAAEHLRMAGELDAAAEGYCAAARAADEAGAPQAAAQHVRRALAVLASLPASPGRRRLKVRALIELGRLQWHSAGPELGSTLREALATLEGARRELASGDPVALHADLCQAIAGVCFDLGDLRSLERALEELSAASRALHAAGDSTGAARLLNDQAAVYVRMGDPVRALHLLRESRQVFEARSADDPVVLRELAETDQLFARIPLHAQLRPGRERDGYSMGLDHAIAAERAYRRLGDTREVARVWETMGRLELCRGRIEQAAQRLRAATEVQAQIGDLTGLARTTEALSEVLAASGRDAEALALLRDSVLFNREKGSPLGVALCRRAFDGLARRLAGREDLRPQVREVADLLGLAEGELGALRLPGEGD